MLAAALLRLQLDDDWGLFRLASYAPVLGAPGLCRHIEAALAKAKQCGCSPAAWLEIAAAREAYHPEEAIVIYRNQIEITLQRTGNRGYDEAVAGVRNLGELFARVNRPGDFRRRLVELKGRYRAQRNLMRRLEEVRG